MDSSVDAGAARDSGADQDAGARVRSGDAFVGALRQRVARELASRSLPVLLALAVLGLVVTLAAAPDQPRRLVAPTIAVIAVLAAMAVARRRPFVAATGLLLAGFALVVAGVVLNGGVRAPVHVGAFALVIGAANVFGHRAAILTGVATVALGAVALVAEEQGWLDPGAPASARVVFFVDAAWLAVIVAFAAVPVRVMTSAFRESEAARRQAAASRAREQEQRRLLETLFDNARHAVGLLDGAGRVRVMNRAMLELLDVGLADVVGTALVDIPALAGAERPVLAAAIAKARVGGRTTLHVRWGGGAAERHLDLGLRPAVNPAADGEVVVEARDRTEFERVRAALNVEQQRYEAVFQHANDAIFLMRGDRFIACNPRTCELFACAVEDVVGATPMDFSPPVQPDGRTSKEAARIYMDAVFAGAPQRFDWQHRRLDGRLVDCEVSLNAVDIGGERHVVALVRDVGERRELEARLRHAERLDSIGQLAGGVAHDFNNLLAAIIGATDVMRLEAKASDVEPWIQMIEDASRRAADLTQQLLRFARRGIDDVGPVSLREVIERAAALLRRTVDKRVTIALDLQARADRVLGSATALQSALLNLGINASHAMPEGGVFEVASRELVLGRDGRPPWLAGLAVGRYVQLIVTDTGAGIAADIIGRVFDPFFTTKEQGKGTGLGLAAVYGTVREHGGAITVSSELGKGARFDIVLPASGAPPEAPAVVREEPLRGAGRVLVVDDEPAVRRAARGLLESLGYEVLEAGDGAEGLRAFAHERPDLVLLDLTMPVMGGRDCFERIRDLDPRARVLLTSGYGPSEDIDAMRAAGLAGLVRKPHRRAELGRAVSAAMSDGGEERSPARGAVTVSGSPPADADAC